MADRVDPIEDDTPHKRRKLNTGAAATGKIWDSGDDSGDEIFKDFESEATLPLPQNPQKKNLGYSAAQMHADLGSSTHDRPSSQTARPTPTLSSETWRTQPTQPLPPRDPPSEIQVERSSPVAPSAPPQRMPAPAPMFSRPNGVLASAMQPAGTNFRRPAMAKPIAVEVDSDDDPPIQRGSQATQGVSSNIRPTNFKRAGRGLESSPNRIVKDSPQPVKRTGFDDLLSSFVHKPKPTPTPARKPADDSASAYGSVSRPPRPPQPSRQTGLARAQPVPEWRTQQKKEGQVYRSLDDVEDYELRKKVERVMGVMGAAHTVQSIVHALAFRKGNANDAMEWMAQQQEEKDADGDSDRDELAISPVKKGFAKAVPQNSTSSSQVPRNAAKQEVKVPTKSIAEKYKRAAPTKPLPVTADSDEEDEDVVPRARRPNKATVTITSSPPTSPAVGPRKRLGNRNVVTIDSDSELDSGVGRELSEQPVPIEPPRAEQAQVDMQELRDERLLKLINECTAHDLAELSGQPEETIQFVLDQRPFISLDAVREVVQETLTKTGKKSKKTKAVGDKLVEDCTEVMTGYDAIDELVMECEKLARPVQEALRGWGVGDADGELQLMSLDEAHDSGIGTPSSSCPPDETPRQKGVPITKKGFTCQPSIMSPDLVMKNYQLVGLNWLHLLFKKELSCILADDMGLGKTCQIIAFLSYLKMKEGDGVHLIIVPGSTLENWLREFQKFSPDLRVQAYYGPQSERETMRFEIEENYNELDVIVTTYDMAVKPDDNRFFRKLGKFSVCVYDEAHALRNPKSQRYQQLVRIAADHKVLLTGTPLQNNLQELIAILAFIMPEMFQKKREDLEYIFKHKASTKDTASAALLSGERIARARTMMTPFILRRKKQQVLDLPAKHRRVEYCELTDTQANLYGDVIEEAQRVFLAKAAGGAKVGAKQTSNVMMALRQAAIHPLMLRRIYTDKKLDKLITALSKSDEFGDNPLNKIRDYLTGDAAQSLKGGDFGLHKFCVERPSIAKKFALKNKEWMDSGKVEKFSELVQKYVKNGDRVLVFSQFTTLMDILEAVLEELSIKFTRLDGSTRMDTRQDIIDKFMEDESIGVFMLSTKAGGAGINLAAANKVIIFDSGFNPQDDIQAENRAHRVGQTREVEVVRLITRGTIEEQIHALGESKLALDERVAGEGATGHEEKEAEKAGEQMVENMLKEKLNGEKKEDDVKHEVGCEDLKDAFKKRLEGEGVRVASKQAQF